MKQFIVIAVLALCSTAIADIGLDLQHQGYDYSPPENPMQLPQEEIAVVDDAVCPPPPKCDPPPPPPPCPRAPPPPPCPVCKPPPAPKPCPVCPAPKNEYLPPADEPCAPSNDYLPPNKKRFRF